MLHITRELSEQIKLGESTTLTVLQLLPGKIILQLEAPGVQISAPIQQGRNYDFEVDKCNVTVRLNRVVRGVAFMSFDAPRALRIINAERLGNGA
jgi:hypothetical protein